MEGGAGGRYLYSFTGGGHLRATPSDDGGELVDTTGVQVVPLNRVCGSTFMARLTVGFVTGSKPIVHQANGYRHTIYLTTYWYYPTFFKNQYIGIGPMCRSVNI